jgi:hypothetical protein
LNVDLLASLKVKRHPELRLSFGNLVIHCRRAG